MAGLSKIKIGGLHEDCIDGTKVADNSIDSDHFATGSVDHAHLSNDCVDGDNIADDAVDSEHINNGAIDHAHLSNDCVDGDNIAHNADLPNGVLAATQTAGDNTRKLATTAFVTTAVGALSQDLISTDVTQSASRTFADNQNHAMVGPMTLNSGVVFTIPSGAKLSILN